MQQNSAVVLEDKEAACHAEFELHEPQESLE